MNRLRGLPVREVFAGHNAPMSRARMLAGIGGYLQSRAVVD
jgi:hypothetical protein